MNSELRDKLAKFDIKGMHKSYFQATSSEYDQLSRIKNLNFLMDLLDECDNRNRHPSIMPYRKPLFEVLEESIDFLNKKLHVKMQQVTKAKEEEEMMSKEAALLLKNMERMDTMRQNIEEQEKELEERKKKIQEYSTNNPSILEKIVNALTPQ